MNNDVYEILKFCHIDSAKKALLVNYIESLEKSNLEQRKLIESLSNSIKSKTYATKKHYQGYSIVNLQSKADSYNFKNRLVRSVRVKLKTPYKRNLSDIQVDKLINDDIDIIKKVCCMSINSVVNVNEVSFDDKSSTWFAVIEANTDDAKDYNFSLS